MRQLNKRSLLLSSLTIMVIRPIQGLDSRLSGLSRLSAKMLNCFQSKNTEMQKAASVACALVLFLASQDALEVMFVSPSVTLRTNLTDVTLVSEDTC